MKTSQENFGFLNIIDAEVGTTGRMGGDAGHGGETYVKLTNDSATSWLVVVIDEDGVEQVMPQPSSIMISMQGDSELQTLSEALEWAGKKINILAD